ncbi:hypothetical protein R3W88_017790 [Solanum pinnatisectum]|uniref:Uncharacterized protein n=1 Tax=Solanum pinnatisectum TaxID=50273 RepID=A0AAV9L1B7_9SOLN|nr:hypothetical protein R3W88_017790 [Solanum pinnatisectum]
MTSKIQLCDDGIIRAFFQDVFYHRILEGCEVGQSNPAKINILYAINFALPAWTTNVHEVQSLEEIVDTIGKSNVEDDIIPLEPVMHKEALIGSRTFHNFMMQFEKTTPKLLDAIRKVRNELQLDLNFKKKQNTIESYFTKLS